MPELPDIAAYITALEPRIVGEPIEHIRLASPFLLRTVEPPLSSVEGRVVDRSRTSSARHEQRQTLVQRTQRQSGLSRSGRQDLDAPRRRAAAVALRSTQRR